MSEEYEIKRKISRLSSRLYGDIRTICGTEGLTQNRLEELIQCFSERGIEVDATI